MYHTRTPIYIIWGGETSNMCFCSPLKLEKMSKIWLTFFRCVSKSPTSHIFFPAGVVPLWVFYHCSVTSLPQISVATNDLMQGMQVGEPLGFSETSCHDVRNRREHQLSNEKRPPGYLVVVVFWGISGMEYFPVNYVGIISNKIQGSILNSQCNGKS